jgi:hypothetical protein
MPRLHIIYDPKDFISPMPDPDQQFGYKIAMISVPKDIKTVDLYNLAKRLAEALLEQL